MNRAISAKPGNGYEITYDYRTSTDIKNENGSTHFTHYDAAGLANVVIEIPLPQKAKFIRAHNPNQVRYDPAHHKVIVTWGFLANHWYAHQPFVVKYEGLTPGEQVQF
ncbi:MAG: hypothetical protein Q4B28_03485 [bacterium]|nr:hypothetical protein [bacterium]